MKKLTLLVSLALVLGLVVGCPQPNDSGNGGSSGTGNGNGGGTTPTHIPVTDIEGVIKSATVGIEATITGTVAPESATKKAIAWSIKDAGTTGVTELTDANKFTAQTAGTLTVLATIKDGKAVGEDYAQDFSITVNAGFEAVTNITMDTTEAVSGTEFTLRPTVEPDNATNQNIAWSVVDAGGTGVTDADLQDGKFTATTAGTLKVKATIENGIADGTDYTKEFTINVEAQKYTLTIITLAGASTVTETHAEGERVHISAGAVSGYDFSYWSSSDGGTFVNENLSDTTFTMPANTTTIEAHFIPEPATIQVNNVYVTQDNKGDVLQDGGTVSFNFETQTLTLNNATLTTPGQNFNLIYIETPNKVTIQLLGTNTMSGGSGIRVNTLRSTGGDLHITGTGSLTFDGASENGLWLYDEQSDFTMNSGTLTITNSESYVNGNTTLSGTANVHVVGTAEDSAIILTNLTMSDSAVLTATGTGTGIGLALNGTFSMEGGEIIATASSNFAIRGSMNVAKGEITATTISNSHTAFQYEPSLADGSQYAVMEAGSSASNITTNLANTTTFTNGKYVHIEVTN